jgi:hypothetical protein
MTTWSITTELKILTCLADRAQHQHPQTPSPMVQCLPITDRLTEHLSPTVTLSPRIESAATYSHDMEIGAMRNLALGQHLC